MDRYGDAWKQRSLAAMVDFAQWARQQQLEGIFRARICALLPGWTPPERAVTAPIVSAGFCTCCSMPRLFVGTPAVEGVICELIRLAVCDYFFRSYVV